MLKLPSLLKWLIERRGRIDGSIQKIELYLNKNQRVFEKCQELTSELSLLKETLISIDTTLRLHKLQIDPENIPAIHGKNYLTDLPRGNLTVMICEKIRKANGLPASSKEVIDFVIERRLAEGAAPIPKISLSLEVRRRMNG
jgi:hypothetical protein